MIHQYTSEDSSGDHWGVSHTFNGEVLAQLSSAGEQVRLMLTADQANAFAGQLKVHALICITHPESAEPPVVERRIICAANLVNKHIICGARHYDQIMQAQMALIDESYSGANVIQGFIDQYGVFLTRQEAYQVAKASGQIIRLCGGDQGCLYSENLY